MLSCIFCFLLLNFGLAFSVRIRSHSYLEKGISMKALRKLCNTNLTSLNNHLDNILVVRPVGSEGHDDVEDYVFSTLENLDFSVRRHSFYASTPDGAGQKFTNIIATWDMCGIANKAIKEQLVLACHYDSKHFEHFKFFGAIDSALPCAVLLNTAETLKEFMEETENTDISLELVFFDGEEAFRTWTQDDSLYGSRMLANKWSTRLHAAADSKTHHEAGSNGSSHGSYMDRIDLFVLLDLLGSVDAIVWNYPINDFSAYNFFPSIEEKLTQMKCLKTRSEAHFRRDLMEVQIADDQSPFLEQGVPVVHLISYPFPSVWHTPDDNRDALDADTVHNIASIVRVFTAMYLGIT